MFDTNIVVVGNVLTAPEWRRTASTNTLVANFRVASTARRMDRETGRWVDGNHFRVRVNCWRRLAEGVAASVTVGDPVVVAGRLFTRDWTDSEGNLRTMYEMEAVSVGHDLSRGRGRFFRNKPAGVTSAMETAEAEGQVRGEAALPVPDEEAPAVYGDGLLDGEEPTFEDAPATTPDDNDRATARGYTDRAPTPDNSDPAPRGLEQVAAPRGGGIEPFDTAMVVPADTSALDVGTTGRHTDGNSASDTPSVAGSGSGAAPAPGPGARPGAGSRSRRPAEPGSAAGHAGVGRPAQEAAAEEETSARRSTRTRNTRRQPVPA